MPMSSARIDVAIICSQSAANLPMKMSRPTAKVFRSSPAPLGHLDFGQVVQHVEQCVDALLAVGLFDAGIDGAAVGRDIVD